MATPNTPTPAPRPGRPGDEDDARPVYPRADPPKPKPDPPIAEPKPAPPAPKH
jgi:hypothetical protein